MKSHYMFDPTNKNRRKKLKERANKSIDKMDMPNNQKVFLKLEIQAIIKEYAELWECRPTKANQL